MREGRSSLGNGASGAAERAAEDERTRRDRNDDERSTLELIEKVARAVVARGMAAPAIFLLESSKPLSFLGSQALHFLEPFVRALMDSASFAQFAKALEDRENVERLLVRIETLDEEARAAERAARERRRAEKDARKRARKREA